MEKLYHLSWSGPVGPVEIYQWSAGLSLFLLGQCQDPGYECYLPFPVNLTRARILLCQVFLQFDVLGSYLMMNSQVVAEGEFIQRTIIMTNNRIYINRRSAAA
jgi:hypothetical protein